MGWLRLIFPNLDIKGILIALAVLLGLCIQGYLLWSAFSGQEAKIELKHEQKTVETISTTSDAVQKVDVEIAKQTAKEPAAIDKMLCQQGWMRDCPNGLGSSIAPLVSSSPVYQAPDTTAVPKKKRKKRRPPKDWLCQNLNLCVASASK